MKTLQMNVKHFDKYDSKNYKSIISYKCNLKYEWIKYKKINNFHHISESLEIQVSKSGVFLGGKGGCILIGKMEDLLFEATLFSSICSIHVLWFLNKKQDRILVMFIIYFLYFIYYNYFPWLTFLNHTICNDYIRMGGAECI